MAGRSFATSAASKASHHAKGDGLLRVAHACETMLAGFESGQAAALKSCLVSKERAISVSELNGAARSRSSSSDGGTWEPPRDLLPPLEEAMVNRRARPSILVPAWRAVGYAVGKSATALLPVDTLAKVQDAISSAVVEQYDDNIRSLYDASMSKEEQEMKELFKAQRDDPLRARLTSGISEGNDSGIEGGSNAAGGSTSSSSGDAAEIAVTGALSSAFRMACNTTAKV